MKVVFSSLPAQELQIENRRGITPSQAECDIQFRNFLVSRLLPILGGFRSENLVKKKYLVWTQKIWSGIKSLNFRFGKFDL